MSWSEMARSPQLMRFLDYIVTRRLEGEGPSIKAYSIAVDVLGRSSDFDPQADPIVRVQARRLRALLDQYYSGPGADETVRIELPVGRYVPEFLVEERREPSAGERRPNLPAPAKAVPPAPRGHVTISWFVLLVIAVGSTALAYSLSTWGPRQESLAQASGAMQRPRLTVMEFQNLTGDSSTISATAGLAIEVVTDLEPFGTVNARYGGTDDNVDLEGRTSDFVLTGIVRRAPNAPQILQYSVILTDLLSSGVVWSKSMTIPAVLAGDGRTLDQLSVELVSVLGSVRGPLHARAREFLAQNSITGQENAYLCRMLFDMYRDTGTFAASERANACYTALGERDRQAGPALAAVASLTAEFSGGGGVASEMDRLRIAGNMIAIALRIASTDSFVWEQKARLHEVMGEHDQAEAAYGSALQLNPGSMDALAARARHLALIGRLSDAAPMAKAALQGAPSPPGWYLGVGALAALERDEFGPAAEYAETYSQADRELGPILAIMAAQGLGDADMVNRYLPRVLEVPGFRAHGIITQLRRRIVDDALLDAIRSALLEAGVPALSLIRAF
ncbi:MAG: hypothetical protein KIS86_03830 [Devosia sp.]|nr:hypothetical protein [Devosia sp.]